MQTSISKEAIEELPLDQFQGTIHLIETPEQLDAILPVLRMETILGFDTETKPAFKKGVLHKVALLQLSNDHTAWLIRLHKTGISIQLIGILEDPHILKVGLAVRDDLRGLQRMHKFSPRGFVELQDVAKVNGITDFSLKKLAGLVLNIRISKRQRLSNWEAGSLTESQAVYAATDAWVSLRIFQTLLRSIDPEPVIASNLTNDNSE